MDGRRNRYLQQRGHHQRHPHQIVQMQERIISQNREIQSLLLENQRLAATHVALKQELSASQNELRRVSVATTKLKSERDAQVRVIHEQSLKTEAELQLHCVEDVRDELIQVRAKTNHLNESRIKMAEELKAIINELEQFRVDAEKVPVIKADIVKLQYEIEMGRAALEYEKNTHAENLEQEQEMEKNMVILARELKRIRAELTDTEKRANAGSATAANPGTGYAGDYGNSDGAYGRSSYMENYGMQQVQAGANGGSQY